MQHPQVLSPKSQVRFEDQIRKDRLYNVIHEWQEDDAHSPAFLFEGDELRGIDNDDEEEEDVEGGGQGDGDKPILPSEAQLTLLCLNYLCDLRRSYDYVDGNDTCDGRVLCHAKGLDPDCIALAVWALSRGVCWSTSDTAWSYSTGEGK